MTSRITVRRDHRAGHRSLAVLSGWESIAPIHLSGRVTRVPLPVIAVNRRLIASPARP